MILHGKFLTIQVGLRTDSSILLKFSTKKLKVASVLLSFEVLFEGDSVVKAEVVIEDAEVGVVTSSRRLPILRRL